VILIAGLDRLSDHSLCEGGSYLLLGAFGENERVRVEPFAAVALELAALWPNTVTPLPDL
jgi:hypothetical protein